MNFIFETELHLCYTYLEYITDGLDNFIYILHFEIESASE